MKRALAALVGITFVFASVGLLAAQPAAAKTDPAAKTEPAAKADPVAKTDAPPKKPVPHTAAGTVKSAGADSLVVAGKVKGKDTEWTFALGDKTRIKKAGKDVTAKDLAAGDKVSVRYTDAAGKMTAMSVSVSAGATKQAAKDEPKR